MKHLTIVGLIVLSAGTASAAPFTFQQQIGSSELDPSIWEGPATTQAFTASNLTPSLFTLYEDMNIDGSADFAYVGQIMPTVDPGISSYDRVMN